MKVVVYHGSGRKGCEEVEKPGVPAATDAMDRVDAATICGTDLHILKWDVSGGAKSASAFQSMVEQARRVVGLGS